MKRVLIFILCAMLLNISVFADEARSYSFELSSNGTQAETVKPGDILTFTLTLHRTDSPEAAPMYAMQDEIRYDADFFRLVEGGSLMRSGVDMVDISIQGSERCLLVSFVSFTGGEAWEADTLIGTFQMEVIGTDGSSSLVSTNALVSNQDGSGSFSVATTDATAVITPSCTIRIDPKNGDDITEYSAEIGDFLSEPETPVWGGYAFTGWSRDTVGLQYWDFDEDTVTGNMTLYGVWEAVSPQAEQQDVMLSSPAIPVNGNTVIIVTLLFTATIVVLVIQNKRKKR